MASYIKTKIWKHDRLIEKTVKKHGMCASFKFFDHLNNPEKGNLTLEYFLIEHNIKTGYVLAEDTKYKKTPGSPFGKRYIYCSSKEALVWLIKKLKVSFPKMFSLYALMPNEESLLCVDIDFNIPQLWRDQGMKYDTRRLMDVIAGTIGKYLINNIEPFNQKKFDSNRNAWYCASRVVNDGKTCFRVSMHLLNDTVVFANYNMQKEFWKKAKNEFQRLYQGLKQKDKDSTDILAVKALLGIDLHPYRRNSLIRIPFASKRDQSESCIRTFNRFASDMSISEHIDFHWGNINNLNISEPPSSVSKISSGMSSSTTSNTVFSNGMLTWTEKRVRMKCPYKQAFHERNGQLIKTYSVAHSDWSVTSVICLDNECSRKPFTLEVKGNLKYPWALYNLKLSVETLKIVDESLEQAREDGVLRINDATTFVLASNFDKHNSGTIMLYGTKNLQCTSQLCTDPFTIAAILDSNGCFFYCKKCGCMYNMLLYSIQLVTYDNIYVIFFRYTCSESTF